MKKALFLLSILILANLSLIAQKRFFSSGVIAGLSATQVDGDDYGGF